MTSYSSSSSINPSLLDFDWWSTVEQQQEHDEEEDTGIMMMMNDSLMMNTIIPQRQRLLKQAGDYQRPDYSVLSVTVMTLGLIIMVEFVKHKVDHMAHGKRYFTAVLQTFYTELTILGMVEFLVWLLQEYYDNMNKDKKQVFAQVHFALFYTAIFNALQSVILHHVVKRLSQKLWVQTEALELNHYVEIREEFDAVSQQIQRRRRRQRNNNNKKKTSRDNSGSHSSSSPSDANGSSSYSQQQQQHQPRDYDHQQEQKAEFAFEYNWTGIQFLWHSTCKRLAHPHLSRRYSALLTQVRFHELRVHFVEANHLPPNFRVSDYLVRSEEAVLIKLLHVTTCAWLFLTASANLLYYILGICLTETGNLQLPGQVLIYIFFVSMALFILVALAVYNKMKLIFKNIMHRSHLWETKTPEQHDQKKRIDDSDQGENYNVDEQEEFNHLYDYYSSKKEALEAEQLALFWASSPKLVITAIQFMQFGYALCLSVVIIFWTEINDASVHMTWYLLAIVVCYGIFVWICARTVPRYTLCTSLGQLVDKKRLHETVAIYRLDEARKAAAALQAAAAPAHHHHHHHHHHHDDYDNDKPQPPTLALFAEIGSPGKNDDDDPLSRSAHGFNIDDLEVPSAAVLKNTRSRRGGNSSRIYYGRPTNRNSTVSTRSTLQHSMAAGDLAFSGMVSSSGGSVSGRSTGSGSESIAMMVKMDTHTLRSLLPRDELEKLSKRDQKKNSKKKGGAAAPTRGVSFGVAAMAGIREEPKVPEWPHQQNMQQQPAPEITSNEDNDDKASDRLSPLDTTPANLRARRPSLRRQKSVSDGVALMGAILEHDYGNSGVGGGEEEKSSSDIEPPPVPLTVSSATPVVHNVDSSDNESMTIMALMAARERSEQPQADAATPKNCSNELVEYNDDHVPEYANYLHKDNKHYPSTGEHAHGGGMCTGEIVEYKKPLTPKLSFLERCSLYYKSKKYVVVSNVFGTMFAFFLVATRVERFLHTENIIPSGMFVSFHFDQRPTFWLLSTCMYMFILNDLLLILALPGYSSLRRFRERRVWVSALIDMAIVYACIMVFNIAEVERCCYPTDGDDELDADDYDLDSQIGVKSVFQKADAYDTKDAYAAKDHAYGEKNYTIGVDPHPCDCPVFGSRLYGGLGHLEPYTSLLALRLFRFWAAGVIVRFLDGQQGKVKSKTERAQDAKDRKRLNPMDVHGEEHHDDHGHCRHREESGTAAELWEAAVAGHPELVAKYGEFSRELLLAMLNIPIFEEKLKDLSLTTSPESSSSLETENNGKKSIVKVDASAMTTATVFKHDGKATISPSTHESSSSSLFFKSDDSKLAYANFQEPDAPLVLSMHRCERKVLPILENWCTVDVVMTPYEMVYFDVSSSGDKNNSVVEGAIRQALMATKGGQGLSLCAVASIRRVVGHVRFSDVTGIAVDKSRLLNIDPNRTSGAVASECIQIQTCNGHTLCLKFYCNSLVEHRNNNNNGSLEQWVKMIRLYCGLKLSPSLNVTAYDDDDDDDDDESLVEI